MINLRRMYGPVKWFVQRGRRGYSDRDLWSFDLYLAEVIANGVGVLSERTHGYPSDLPGITEWQDILEELADGFRSYYENELADYHSDKDIRDSLDKSLDLLKQWFTGLWD